MESERTAEGMWKKRRKKNLKMAQTGNKSLNSKEKREFSHLRR